MSGEDPVQAVAEALAEHWRDMHTNESLGYQRMLATHAVAAAEPHLTRERDALADLAQRQKEAIRELSSELVEVAQRSPQALTLLQLEAVVNERDALAARLAAVERALDDEEANLADDGARLSHAVVRRLRAALATTNRQEADQ